MKYLIFAFLLLGCESKPSATPGQIAQDNDDLRSYEDTQRGVTCYRVRGYDGLSCLKTKLSLKEQIEENQLKEIFGDGE